MRKQQTLGSPEAALGRVLDALEQELIDASDEEILEAAKDLGMNPMMKGSAAFLGLKYFGTARFADFFDLEALKQLRAELQLVETRIGTALPRRENRKPKPPGPVNPGKDSAGK